MTQSQRRDAGEALARRLRELRTRHWPDLPVTQRDLATALSTRSRATGPLISSWENVRNPVVPPPDRLAAYATFFATRRSLTESKPRLLAAAEMTPEEEEARDQLEAALLELRDAALAQGPIGATTAPDPWGFVDGDPITIICGEVSDEQEDLQKRAKPEHPTLAHGAMYSYADIDTLYELHGQLRASYPRSEVKTVRWKDVSDETVIGHVVIIGRGDRGPRWRDVEEGVQMPLHYGDLDAQVAEHYIELTSGERFSAKLAKTGGLKEDVGLFYRGPNPFAARYTLTICHGMFATGTLHVVRSLIDERLGPENVAYLDVDRANQQSCLFLLRINVVGGVPGIPTWRSAKLYEWRGGS